ncbi:MULTISPECIES: hypothetical protein [Cupriavidus]|uniref:hypothetical protein n=1 Tax=Cupriavidus sp. DF5525 TaxID=3160989 RepID=UPI0032E00B6D
MLKLRIPKAEYAQPGRYRNRIGTDAILTQSAGRRKTIITARPALRGKTFGAEDGARQFAAQAGKLRNLTSAAQNTVKPI